MSLTQHLRQDRRVLTLGACAWTTIFRVPAWPCGSAKILPDQAVQLGDGMSASAACAIAALGGQVSWWGRVGDDSNGRAAVHSLSAAGVDCSMVQWCANAHGSFCSVLVDSHGERLVVPRHDPALPGSADWLALHHVPSYAAVLTEVRWFEGAKAILRSAREQGLPGVLDAEASLPGELAQLCALGSHLLFSQTGLAHLLGQPIHATNCHSSLQQVLSHYPCELAGVTLGEHGFYWLEREAPAQLHHQAALAISAVDTLAAGDVFHGVYTWALASGLSPRACAQLAVSAASLKCQTFGGRLGTPNLQQVEQALAEL